LPQFEHVSCSVIAVTDGVRVEHGRAVCRRPAVAPLGERDDDVGQVSALVGEDVFELLGAVGVSTGGP
jgi:hypothetical protein